MSKTREERFNNFITDIIAVCKVYNLSISHEDTQGAFIITSYKEENISWLKDAIPAFPHEDE